jgi:hypothetical protein
MKIIRNVEPEIVDYADPQAVFEKMADFVTNIDTRYLNEGQQEMLLDILERIEEDEELSEEIKAQRSPSQKKQYAGSYYMKNKQRLKNQKEALKHKVEGKTRKRMGPIMAKQDKTPTGKKKLSYNT